MIYGKAIFGDNQFLGVNHASQAKALDLYKKYSDADLILEVIDAAYSAGVRDFMFTTHDRYTLVFEEIIRSNMFPEMNYTPCLPYAHKYWNQLSEKGVISVLSTTVFSINPMNLVSASLGILVGNLQFLTKFLIEIETLMCRGLPIRGVFLQNLAFDFLLSMELLKIIELFYKTVSDKLGVIPGFITMNHKKASDVLCDSIGLEKPWVCANYNKSGFRMHPSKLAIDESFASGRTNNIAMSVFASGAIDPSEGLEYVVSKIKSGQVNSILFGSSNPKNIEKNVQLILA